MFIDYLSCDLGFNQTSHLEQTVKQWIWISRICLRSFVYANRGGRLQYQKGSGRMEERRRKWREQFAVSLQPKHLWEKGQAQKKNDLFSGQTHEMTDVQQLVSLGPSVPSREESNGKKCGETAVISYRIRIVWE